MTMGRQVSPGVPLTETEQLFAAIAKLSGGINDLKAILQNLAPGGAIGPINIPPDQIQSIIASKAPGTRDFLDPVLTTPVTILTRLVSNYVDYGVLSNLGTSISIQDLSKFWQPGVLVGDLLYIYWGNFLYLTVITNNDEHVLSFNPLSGNANPEKGAIYWIAGTANGAWSTKPPAVIYNTNPLAIGVFQSIMFDFRAGKRAMVKINNTTNQAATVQLMGNGTPDFATAVTMGLPVALAPGGSYASIGVGTNDDWHPYLMMTITFALAPVGAGVVNVTVYYQ